jgi:Rad51
MRFGVEFHDWFSVDDLLHVSTEDLRLNKLICSKCEGEFQSEYESFSEADKKDVWDGDFNEFLPFTIEMPLVDICKCYYSEQDQCGLDDAAYAMVSIDLSRYSRPSRYKSCSSSNLFVSYSSLSEKICRGLLQILNTEIKLKFQQPVLLEPPRFRTALEYRDRFTFGIDKLDSKLQLHLDDMIGIFGKTSYTNALATRLVVRSLLPRNHGGINAENVIVIVADNSSSPYLYVDIARKYGMHHRNVLRKVLVSRQFTIYQLTNTIIYDLPKRIQLYKPKLIAISGLLDQFYQDPYINTVEAESLVSQIVTVLHKIKDVFIILTSRLTDNQIEFPTMSRIEIRAKEVFDETKLNLSIYNNGKLKKVFMTEAQLTN